MRTAEEILAKNEQILDALEHGIISPKTSEQMTQCNKMPMALANLELKMRKQIEAAGRKAPVMRSPLIRSLIPGLDPQQIAPTDGENVRALSSLEK